MNTRHAVARTGYWRWRSSDGWYLLVHWSCAGALIAAAVVGAVLIARENPRVPAMASGLFGGLTGMLLLGSIAAHEFAHLAMARRLRLEPRGVILRGYAGGTLLWRDAPTPMTDALFALSGPAANLSFAAVAGAAALLIPGGPAHTVATWTGVVNALLGFVSLLPCYPLDGGRAIRAWRWHATGDRQRANRQARHIAVGSGVALLLAGSMTPDGSLGWVVGSTGAATLLAPLVMRRARSSFMEAARVVPDGPPLQEGRPC